MALSLQREYNMNHDRRGYAVIFSHKDFQEPYTNIMREGSQVDVGNLERILVHLGFSVQVHWDLTCSEVVSTINTLAILDHSDCDCVLVAVMTHGGRKGLMGADGRFYHENSVWTPFLPDNCPSLGGKPKLFIFQGGQGRLEGETESFEDVLLVYGSSGSISWPNLWHGSLFIQRLCDILEEQATYVDLLKILVAVTRVVALQAVHMKNLWHGDLETKPVPLTVSTLSRDLVFRPKRLYRPCRHSSKGCTEMVYVHNDHEEYCEFRYPRWGREERILFGYL